MYDGRLLPAADGEFLLHGPLVRCEILLPPDCGGVLQLRHCCATHLFRVPFLLPSRLRFTVLVSCNVHCAGRDSLRTGRRIHSRTIIGRVPTAIPALAYLLTFPTSVDLSGGGIGARRCWCIE